MYSTDYHRQFHLWAKREADCKLVMFLNKQCDSGGETTVTTLCLLRRRLRACEDAGTWRPGWRLRGSSGCRRGKGARACASPLQNCSLPCHVVTPQTPEFWFAARFPTPLGTYNHTITLLSHSSASTILATTEQLY
jgi:hypothetical protein